MMHQITVLVFGRHPNMLKKVVQLLEQEGFLAMGETTNEAIFAAIEATTYDLIAIGGGVDSASRTAVKAAAWTKSQETAVVDVFNPQNLLSQVKAAVQNIKGNKR